MSGVLLGELLGTFEDRWADGACRQPSEGDWWLRDADSRGHIPLSRANILAKRICGGCPLAAECLTDALDRGDHGVIRGGVILGSPHEWARCRCGTRFLRPKGGKRKTCSPACRSPMRPVAPDPPSGGQTRHPCGSVQARRRHRYHGENCDRCAVVAAPPNVAPQCGTARGFANHMFLSEDACAQCVAARNSRGRRRLREAKVAA